MADDRWLRWQAEMAGTADGPSIGTVLTMFAAGAALLLTLLSGPADTSTEESATGPRRGPACTELRRLERYGVSSGPTLASTRAACRREANDGR
jgi:hypothetical protein